MGLFLYTHALKDSLRAKRIIPWIAVSLIVALIGAAWPSITRTNDPVHQYGDVAAMLVFRVMALASAIYTTAIIGQEVEQRTIVYILTRPVARWKILLMRYLASVTVVALMGIFSAVLLTLVMFRGNIGANELLLKDILALIMGAFAYGALFLFTSVIWTRAMIICLLFAFGWETVVPNLPGDLYHLSVFSYMQAIAQHPASQTGPAAALTGQLSQNSITPGAAYPTIIIAVVALVLASLWWFTHFEFVPREDAE
jgi:ABC-2 type transport system permease protein